MRIEHWHYGGSVLELQHLLYCILQHGTQKKNSPIIYRHMKKRYIQNATIIKTFVDDTPNEIRIPADAYKLCHTWPFYLPHPSRQSPLSHSVKTEIETWQKTQVKNMRNSVTWLLCGHHANTPCCTPSCPQLPGLQLWLACILSLPSGWGLTIQTITILIQCLFPDSTTKKTYLERWSSSQTWWETPGRADLQAWVPPLPPQPSWPARLYRWRSRRTEQQKSIAHDIFVDCTHTHTQLRQITLEWTSPWTHTENSNTMNRSMGCKPFTFIFFCFSLFK